ncbi:transcription factor S [Candidatus Woesearchaeota archaeon]|nr:transcription factor S [Candidatus Woesearchaeota archaeon]
MEKMFCPKCGSILLPKKEGNKTVVKCSCGHQSAEQQSFGFTEKVKQGSAKIAVVEKDHDHEALPLMDASCPKCGHHKARYWTVQTRAGDEPETKFLTCDKCRHRWRDYN